MRGWPLGPVVLVLLMAVPLFVGGSAGAEGHRRWFFRLGRVF
jgi:hypothetical protein